MPKYNDFELDIQNTTVESSIKNLKTTVTLNNVVSQCVCSIIPRISLLADECARPVSVVECE